MRDVIVLADGDDAGEAAARDVRSALEARGPARAHRPPTAGHGLQRSVGGRHASHRGGACDEHRQSHRLRQPGRRRHRRSRGGSRSARWTGREDRHRPRRSLRTRRAGKSCDAEEGGPRRLRGVAVETEEGRLPRDGARQVHRRGERGSRRARPEAGRHPDRTCAIRRAVPRAGRHRLRRPRHQRPPRNLADPRARASAAGLPAASTRRRAARRVRRRCNRR